MSHISNTKVIFMRHGESKENEFFQSIFDLLARLINFEFSTIADTLLTLITAKFSEDSEISSLGYRQLNDMKMQLDQARFFDKFCLLFLSIVTVFIGIILCDQSIFLILMRF